MLDYDLAGLYEVETKIFNQAVKRNIKRFPKDFMFQLTRAEWNGLKILTNSQNIEIHTVTNNRSQFVTASLGNSLTVCLYRAGSSYVKRYTE